MLVNNVGMSYTHADDYVMVPEDKHVDILNINCMSVSKTGNYTSLVKDAMLLSWLNLNGGAKVKCLRLRLSIERSDVRGPP